MKSRTTATALSRTMHDGATWSRQSHSRRWWLRKSATAVFFAVIAALLVVFAQRVEWGEVFSALRKFPVQTLLLALIPTFGSYLLYSTFDLFGRRYTRHTLRRPLVMTIAFVCYAFTQSLTAWVGGIAMRYRLYSRFGVEQGAIAQIFGISILTNWIGYLLLASVLCIAGVITPPADWPIGTVTLRVAGALLIVPVALYLWFCHRFPDQSHHAFGQEWQLPPLRIGALQLLFGAANWSLMAAVIFVLLGQKVDYVLVLGVLLLSSIAAVIVHVPAGLGVMEAVFIAMLHGYVSRHQTLAAMICYRAVYYLAPLLIALAVYLALEIQARGKRKTMRAQG